MRVQCGFFGVTTARPQLARRFHTGGVLRPPPPPPWDPTSWGGVPGGGGRTTGPACPAPTGDAAGARGRPPCLRPRPRAVGRCPTTPTPSAPARCGRPAPWTPVGAVRPPHTTAARVSGRPRLPRVEDEGIDRPPFDHPGGPRPGTADQGLHVGEADPVRVSEQAGGVRSWGSREKQLRSYVTYLQRSSHDVVVATETVGDG